MRAAADRRIARGYEDADPSLAWRAQELTSARERARLARSLRGVVEDLSPSRLPGASPLNRAALRPHTSLLAELADRLDDLERPVSASGVLAVRRVLTDPDGPLYARPDDPGGHDVAGALSALLEGLEAH